MNSTCLVELGTEELPPRSLQILSQAFAENLRLGLLEFELAPASIKIFATPRRLALLLQDIPARQADQSVEKRGPALDVAFDSEGKPSAAALGFARSCGVDIEQLERRETDKGSWLYFTREQAGQSLAEVLPGLVGKALQKLPIARRMRWGDREDEFVRPLKWLVMMLDGDLIEANILGQASSTHSYGHRFHAPAAIEIPHAGDYEELLRSRGMVIASFAGRKAAIRQMIEKAASQLGGQVPVDENLLDEVTALVEYPSAICGSFDAGFLQIPQEVLVMTMQDNQKYFALYDEAGKLLPHFIAIANIESRQPALVAAGNERVIRPRFADARFFFEQDNKQGLDQMRTRLASVLFQEKLGSLGDKTTRITRLAKYIASQTGADQDLVRRAGELCKADLMSDMVGEFPKLQGVMGHYYARHQQEDTDVCAAIEEHYWPRYSGDKLPQSDIAQAIALADRLDSLVGIFAIGQKPSGDKDPFALRRAALGVVRILIESRLNLDLADLCRSAAEGFAPELEAASVVEDVIEYIFDRLRAYYQEQGIGFDLVDAVTYNQPGLLYDCELRIRALQQFQGHEAAQALAAANKRIGNILKKQAELGSAGVDADLFSEDAERQLYQQLLELQDTVAALFSQGEYLQGLNRLADLRPAVDRFFDDVMVMVDDAAVKNNRLALLAQLLQSFRRVADFSRIQS